MTLGLLVLRPAWWPALLLGPAAGLLLWALDRRRRSRLRAGIGPRIEALAEERSAGRRALRRVLFAGALFFAGVAAIGLDVGASEAARAWRGPDVVLCLDVSRSMRAQDVLPSRLQRAKDEIDGLAKRARGARMGLVEFAGEARLRTPLTEDLTSLALIAREADPTDVERGGTDLGAAIDEAVRTIEGGRTAEARHGGGTRAAAIVLLTDGEDHEGRGLAAAKRAWARDIQVDVLGIGTALGAKIPVEGPAGRVFLTDAKGVEVVSRLDRRSLDALAGAAGGVTVAEGREPGALASLYERRLLPLASASLGAAPGSRRQEGFLWAVAVAFLLALLDLAIADRRPRRRVQRVVRAPALRARASGRRLGASRATVSLLLPVVGASLLLLLAGCDRTAPGRAAWNEGRRADALASFDRAVAEAGHHASAELLWDKALAALAVGRGDEALAAAKAAAARGGRAFEGRFAFVRGSVAFADSHDADAEARRLGGNGQASLHALTLAEDAVAFWQAAAASRADWPEARRNVERGVLWLEHLRTTKGRKKPRPKPSPGGGPGSKPPPLERPKPKLPPPSNATEDPNARMETRELSPADVLRVLETLKIREQEKLGVRRSEARERSAGVKKDW